MYWTRWYASYSMGFVLKTRTGEQSSPGAERQGKNEKSEMYSVKRKRKTYIEKRKSKNEKWKWKTKTEKLKKQNLRRKCGCDLVFFTYLNSFQKKNENDKWKCQKIGKTTNHWQNFEIWSKMFKISSKMLDIFSKMIVI